MGNGKTVTCMMELERLAWCQAPNSDGVRLSRAVIVRNTTPELRTTTVKTWEDWFDDVICPITKHPIIVGYYQTHIDPDPNDPWTETFPDGTTVKMEVYFLAMDKPGDEKKLLGIEPTFILLNETRELSYKVVIRARERIGRYPAPINNYVDKYDDKGKLIYDAPKRRDNHGDIVYKLDSDGEIEIDEHGRLMPVYEPVTRYCLLMDTNPPDDEHWWYHLAVNGHLSSSKDRGNDTRLTEETYDFFDGPQPLIKQGDGSYEINPQAENIDNLPDGHQYYLKMLGGNTDEHINVMVLGKYGALFDGKLVYGQYADIMHAPQKGVAAMPGYALCLGWDFGACSACVICQLVNGQLRVIKELYSDETNTKVFARDEVRSYLQQHYSDYTIGVSVGDPSGGNVRGEEDKSHIGILNDEHLFVDEDQGYEEPPLAMGFLTLPAPGNNDITLRINAVESFTINMREGEPCLVVDRDCTRLRKGFQGGYHYKKVQGSDGTWKEKPNKNHYSHLHDALQYVALACRGGMVQDVYFMDGDGDDDEEYSEPDNCMGY